MKKKLFFIICSLMMLLSLASCKKTNMYLTSYSGDYESSPLYLGLKCNIINKNSKDMYFKINYAHDKDKEIKEEYCLYYFVTSHEAGFFCDLKEEFYTSAYNVKSHDMVKVAGEEDAIRHYCSFKTKFEKVKIENRDVLFPDESGILYIYLAPKGTLVTSADEAITYANIMLYYENIKDYVRLS